MKSSRIRLLSRILLTLLLATAAGYGCTPSIGDACEANADCDTDQICDMSQAGGYCTITPCPREGCPSGSLCVEFSPVSSWCMQQCGVFDYCREGYDCVLNFVDANDETLEPFCNQFTGDETPDASVASDATMIDNGLSID